MLIVPHGWREFQHYKDRNPPWIRLHRKLLDNRDFIAMPAMACKVLVLLWLVAADSPEGVFDDNADDLSFRLRLPMADVEQALKTLKDKGFLVPSDAQPEEEDDRPLSKQIAERNGFGSRHISDRVKREVWMRDEGRCCSCGCEENLEYDHKKPVSKGGNSEADNIQLLCRTCNRKKRAKTAEQVATQAQPWLKLRTTETEAETEAFTEAETEPFRQPAAAGKAKRDPAKSAAAWVAYSDAYRRRYTVEPVRNAQVNAQMAQFVAKVAADEAPEIAAFYLRHNDRFYLSKGHSVGAMLRDAEKLRMEWASGRVVNPTLSNEPAWRTEQRQRTQQAAPGVAVGNAADFFDMETPNVTPIALGR